MSVGPLTDTVITVNVPVVGAAEFGRGDFFMEWGISDMLASIEVRIEYLRQVISGNIAGQSICKQNYW